MLPQPLPETCIVRRVGRFPILTFAVILVSMTGSLISAAELARSSSGLAYLVEGEGRPIVLIHGANLDHRMWDEEAARLSRVGQVIRYDLRAHGQSEIPTGPYLASDDLAGLLEELGKPKVDLIGLSAGAQISIDFALEHPERVNRMVLAGPAVTGYRPSKMPELFGPLMEALQDRDFEQANEVLISSSLFRVPPEKSELVASMVRSNLPIWSVPREYVKQLDPPAIGRLEDLRMPILVLFGDQDLPHIREQAELIAAQAGNARLEIVAGGGHLLNLTSPEAFARLVTEFLQLPRPE